MIGSTYWFSPAPSEVSSSRISLDFGLRSVDFFFRELVVPELGRIWFVRQLSWPLASLALHESIQRQGSNAPKPTAICHGIEALACKMEYQVDPQGPFERILGSRAFRHDHEVFLEAAVQRFSGLRPRQRAELGSILVYLMLDGHASASRQSVLPPGRVPGLHEFQPRGVDSTSLLHAKLALLAFAPNRTADPVHMRLAVLTANFTYTSARQQLELVWTIDIPLDGTARAADGAEVAAAGRFLEQLLDRRYYRDEQALPSKQRRLTSRFDTLLAKAVSVAPSNARPRFIHSLDRPLYEQIRQRFRSTIDSPRNFLLCGSGFYEQPSGKARKPAVFAKLEDLGVFTANVRRVALVEPSEAGAVAPWAAQGTTEGWDIARPSDALGLNRCLHAKFVYVGYLRDGHASNGCLYLGSGNLSRRGLLTSGAIADGGRTPGGRRRDQSRLPRDRRRRSRELSACGRRRR